MSLAGAMVEAETHFKKLEEEAKEAKKSFLEIQQEDLPGLMIEVGLSELTLEDGRRVKVTEEVNAAITAANHPDAMAWLGENGFDGIVKSVVSIEYGRSEVAAAEALTDELQAKGLPVQFKRTVHPQTLKAFVKERMAEGDAIPFDTFSIHPYNIAKLTKK